MSVPEEDLQRLMLAQQSRGIPQNMEVEELVDITDELPELESELSLEQQKAEALALARQKAVNLDRVEQRAENLNSPLKEFEHGAAVGIARTLGMPVDAVSGILTAAGFPTNAPLGSGDNIMDVFAALGIVPEDMPLESTSPAAGAGEYVAGALIMTPAMLYPFMEAAADPNWDLRKANQTAEHVRVPRSRAAKAAFLIRQLGEAAAKTAVENPKAFLATELAVAGLTGAAGEKLEEAGATPGQRMAGEVATGIASTLTLSGIPRALKSMARWSMANLAPMTEAGGQVRAAAQMQRRAEDAATAAQRVADAPSGVSPARATEDPRLMAQEQAILDANPVLDKRVRDDLQAAIRRVQRDLRDLYNTPRGKQDWEYAIVNRVNPTDAPIDPGDAETMLKQVYDNFDPLYRELDGYPVRLHLMDSGRKTTLKTMLGNVPDTRTVVAGEPARATVARWLEAQADEVFKRAKEIDGSPAVMSEDLLNLRSRIREQQRKAMQQAKGAGGTEASDRAALFEVAEARVNQLLKEQLPQEAQELLKTTDDAYRNFKTVDNAAWMSNDKGITPDSLLRALRKSSSSTGSYAHGENMDFRSFAYSGLPIEQYMNNPDMARRYVSQMGAEDLSAVRDGFLDNLMRRSIASELSPDGGEIIDGRKLMGNLTKFERTADAIGLGPEDMGRLRTMAKELRMMQAPQPGAVEALFEDGPSNMIQLVAAMAASRQGTSAARAVGGNSLILAQFFSNKMRNFVAKLTADEATRLMIDAATNRTLYQDLLTRPNALPSVQNAAARRLNSWLLQTTRQKDTDEESDYREQLRDLRREVDQAQRLSPLY